MSKDSPPNNNHGKKNFPGFEPADKTPDGINTANWNLGGGYSEVVPFKLQEFSIDTTTTAIHDFFPGPSLHLLKPLIAKLHQKQLNVCFIGERGSGKEVLANEYMKHSEDSSKLVKINCASYNDELLCSELFGHIKGAFTGADKKKKGLLGSLKEHDGILLDELGAASERFQAALLRLLQFREYSSVGSEERLKLETNILIMAATSEPEKIRSDVLDRFICIHVPPLRYRQGDIPFILKTLWEQSENKDNDQRPDKISRPALNLLKEYSWPGNIRELKNAFQIALILTELDEQTTIRTSAFPTIPTMPRALELSRARKIQNLKADGTFIPITEFLTGWPSIEDPQDAIDCLNECIQGISPKNYEDMFWEYYARKGFSAKGIMERFPGYLAESTINGKLRLFK